MKKYLLVLALAVLSVCSCQKENGPEEQPKVENVYTITSESTVANADDFADGIIIVKRLPDATRNMVPLLLHLYLSSYKDPIRYIKYTYKSVDPFGNPITLSAALALPEKAITDGKALKSLILANHFSSTYKKECPTESNMIEGLLAWTNAAVVMPDYYGFGSTSDKVQAYLNADATAIGNLDALVAAQKILEDLKVKAPDTIYNYGYSQGGFNAMANVKYLANHPEYPIAFTHTYAGGGPYNVVTTFHGFLAGNFEKVFPLVLVTITSFNEIEKLGIPYNQLFIGDLLANYQDWVLSKNYQTSEILALLKTTDPADHFTPAALSAKGYPFEELEKVADKYSVHKGWTPTPGTNITLVHSKADDMVPFENYVSMKQFLEQYSSSVNLETIEYASDTHDNGYLNFFITTLTTWIK